MNTVLPQVKSESLYATFTGFHLTTDGEVFYALAASPPILHWHASDGSVTKTQTPEFPLGLLPFASFEDHFLAVQPGSILLVATDGILEVSDKAADEFGIERMMHLVAANFAETLPALATHLLRVATAFGPQLDDQTLLLIRRLPSLAPAFEPAR